MRRTILFLAMMGALVAGASAALAGPTQDEVFHSIDQNVNSTVDLGQFIPYLVAGVALIIFMAVWHHYRRRKAAPQRVNHPGKLLKEIRKVLDLKPAEIKQIKMLADQQELIYPITLLLCPSTLGKALKNPHPKFDRQIMQQVVARLRKPSAAKEK